MSTFVMQEEEPKPRKGDPKAVRVLSAGAARAVVDLDSGVPMTPGRR